MQSSNYKEPHKAEFSFVYTVLYVIISIICSGNSLIAFDKYNAIDFFNKAIYFGWQKQLYFSGLFISG